MYADSARANHYFKTYKYPGNLDKGLGRTYLDSCLKKSKLGLRSININKAICDSCINIYFIDKDPYGRFTSFHGNCAYTGHRNIIICDVNYIYNFQYLDTIVTQQKIIDSVMNQSDENMIVTGEWTLLHYKYANLKLLT